MPATLALLAPAAESELMKGMAKEVSRTDASEPPSTVEFTSSAVVDRGEMRDQARLNGPGPRLVFTLVDLPLHLAEAGSNRLREPL